MAYVQAEQMRLARSALLLTGDPHSAQDLVQETLVRAFVHWRKVQKADNPHAYVRRIMSNAYLRERERQGRRPVPTDALPDGTCPVGSSGIDDRDQLRQVLLRLPLRQRTAVILRHYEHLTEAETAGAMGCSIGTVKSLTSRGLTALRETFARAEERNAL